MLFCKVEICFFLIFLQRLLHLSGGGVILTEEVLALKKKRSFQMHKICMMFFPVVLIISGCSNLGKSGENVRDSFSAQDTFPVAESAAGVSRKAMRAHAVNSVDGGFFRQSSRQMAYTAGFTVVVKEEKKALDELKNLCEKLGGYLVSSARGNMRMKVPVKNADEFVKKAGNFGKVSDFRISAEDLTDTITDLGVRLDNLRKLRARLTELLNKAQKVEEMLKVERELNRVTTEIERIDAQLQNNKNRVAFVTFDVAVIVEHGAMPGGTPEAVNRFAFLKKLASNEKGDEDKPLFNLNIPDILVPVTGGADGSGFAATTSDDCLFRSWETEISENSKLEFWRDLCCKALKGRFGFDQVKVFPVKFNGLEAFKITAERVTAKGTESYFAVISVKRCWNDYLQIVEFFGPSAAFAKYEKEISKAVLK